MVGLAAYKAIASLKIFNGNTINTKALLVGISASKNGLTMSEVNQAMNVARTVVDIDVQITFGASYDESLHESLRVTIIAVSPTSPR